MGTGKQKVLHQFAHRFRRHLVYCLRLFYLMNLKYFLSRLISVQGREPNFGECFGKSNNIGLNFDIYKVISLKLCMVRDTAKVYSIIPV